MRSYSKKRHVRDGSVQHFKIGGAKKRRYSKKKGGSLDAMLMRAIVNAKRLEGQHMGPHMRPHMGPHMGPQVVRIKIPGPAMGSCGTPPREQNLLPLLSGIPRPTSTTNNVRESGPKKPKRRRSRRQSRKGKGKGKSKRK